MPKRSPNVIKKMSKGKRRVIIALYEMPIVEVALKKANVPRSTYYRWREEDSQFSDLCELSMSQSRELINDLAESKLIANIKDNQFASIRFWLTNNSERYRYKEPSPEKERMRKMQNDMYETFVLPSFLRD